VTVVGHRDDVVRMLRERGRLVLQEHLGGSPRTANWILDAYLDASGRCRFWATGRKVSQHPPYAGTATHAVAERNETLARPVISFLEGLGYAGPVDVDLRIDERDGRALLLDVNPRVGATFRAFVSPEGLDVVRCAYLDLVGQPIPDVTVLDGRGWILESHVTTGVLPYRKDGWMTLRAWFGSMRGVHEGALMATDDLRPVVRAAGHVAVRATTKLWRSSGVRTRREGFM
jgi:predicted ATP-grasp superfamily ATP-dependent carboligase